MTQNTAFSSARFITSAIDQKGYPDHLLLFTKTLPEIAVVGRSNVGKSSLLNFLFNTTKLVKTSSLPGKTQLLNFFLVDNRLVFVDFPGYGYAKVSFSKQKSWGKAIQSYLENRSELKLILFLFDSRRIPNEEDLMLMNWIEFHNIPVILVLTKADKLNQSEKVKNPKQIIDILQYQNEYVLCSTLKKMGKDSLITKINHLVCE